MVLDGQGAGLDMLEAGLDTSSVAAAGETATPGSTWRLHSDPLRVLQQQQQQPRAQIPEPSLIPYEEIHAGIPTTTLRPRANPRRWYIPDAS
ncbi:unnamed protein product [Lampetra planeri]